MVFANVYASLSGFLSVCSYALCPHYVTLHESMCVFLRKRLHVDVGEDDVVQDVDPVNAV